jgi:hypothetical protein
MGLCIPQECDESSLKVLFDKLYMQGIAYTKIMNAPNQPEYAFPRSLQKDLSEHTVCFTVMIILLVSFIGLSIWGYFIEKTPIGDFTR